MGARVSLLSAALFLTSSTSLRAPTPEQRCVQPQYPQSMLYPLEFVPVMHGTDTPLCNILGEPHIVERNQNSGQDVIVHLSFFSNIHNSMRVAHLIFSDYAPRESWKLGTQIFL